MLNWIIGELARQSVADDCTEASRILKTEVEKEVRLLSKINAYVDLRGSIEEVEEMLSHSAIAIMPKCQFEAMQEKARAYDEIVDVIQKSVQNLKKCFEKCLTNFT